MYTLPYYTEQDTENAFSFMKENAFVVITGIGETYPVATQVPVVIEIQDGKIVLSGHIMRKSDHHLAFEKNNNVLVLFTGPHCYVSADWYTNPSMGSTWNYMTVQARGKISFMDEAGTRNAVKEVSDKYTGTTTAAAYDNLPEEYIERMVKGIVGFSIEVESVENTFKLSQNRDAQSQLNIISQLRKRGDHNSLLIAGEMEKRIEH